MPGISSGTSTKGGTWATLTGRPGNVVMWCIRRDATETEDADVSLYLGERVRLIAPNFRDLRDLVTLMAAEVDAAIEATR